MVTEQDLNASKRKYLHFRHTYCFLDKTRIHDRQHRVVGDHCRCPGLLVEQLKCCRAKLDEEIYVKSHNIVRLYSTLVMWKI